MSASLNELKDELENLKDERSIVVSDNKKLVEMYENLYWKKLELEHQKMKNIRYLIETEAAVKKQGVYHFVFIIDCSESMKEKDVQPQSPQFQAFANRYGAVMEAIVYFMATQEKDKKNVDFFSVGICESYNSHKVIEFAKNVSKDTIVKKISNFTPGGGVKMSHMLNLAQYFVPLGKDDCERTIIYLLSDAGFNDARDDMKKRTDIFIKLLEPSVEVNFLEVNDTPDKHTYMSHVVTATKGFHEKINIKRENFKEMFDRISFTVSALRLLGMRKLGEDVDMTKLRDSILKKEKNVTIKSITGFPAYSETDTEWEAPQEGKILELRIHKESFGTDLSKEVIFENPIKFAMRKNPFARGGLRHAFVCYDITNKRQLVAKESVYENIFNSVTHHLKDLRCQTVAKLLADLFNQEVLQAEKKTTKAKSNLADYLPCYILEVTSSGKKKYYFVEPFLQGNYEKYINNNGAIPRSATQPPEAFAHFSYHKTGGALIVLDVQGVNNILTDPQIITADPLDIFGLGHHGTAQIAPFFKFHECNDLCRKLGLENLTGSPYLPLKPGPAELVCQKCLKVFTVYDYDFASYFGGPAGSAINIIYICQPCRK